VGDRARGPDGLCAGPDVEIEHQNRDLLRGMNRRVLQQLRLQQTVEGLSIAAISYDVVSLAGYVFKGLQDFGVARFDPIAATALSVPAIVVIVALMVRRVRRHYAEPDLKAVPERSPVS
jgi:uncharacterized membrane-anchored protein